MKIVLMKDYKSLGKQGDVLEVKSGYASNFLIPAAIAEPANQESIKKAKAGIKVAEIKFPDKAKSEIKVDVNIDKAFGKIDGKKFRMMVPVSSGGRLVGDLSSKQVCEYLLDTWKLKDKNVELKLDLGTQIKETGKYSIDVSLVGDKDQKSGRIILEIVGE